MAATGPAERCGALTGKLNCGCCDEVRLSCDLPAQPPHTQHQMTLDAGVPTPIRWCYVTAYDPQKHTS